MSEKIATAKLSVWALFRFLVFIFPLELFSLHFPLGGAFQSSFSLWSFLVFIFPLKKLYKTCSFYYFFASPARRFLVHNDTLKEASNKSLQEALNQAVQEALKESCK